MVKTTSYTAPQKRVNYAERFFFVLAVLMLSAALNAQTTVFNGWKDISESSIKSNKGVRYIIPEKYRTTALDLQEMKCFLSNTPMEGTNEAAAKRVTFMLPLPNGKNVEYAVSESPIMAPALAAQFPELKTYIVEGNNAEAGSGRIDFTPAGFHAIIFTPEGTVYIDPYRFGATESYTSYYKHDYNNISKRISIQNCIVDHPEASEEIHRLMAYHRLMAPSNQLRTYRLALACTGEYAAFHGGTVATAMNGIVTTMNRVNGVYTKELSIKMILVDNNSSIVYTNSSTDPFTNNNGSTMLSQNQTTCDNIIGTANYDIGHVFSTGGGGIAGLGVVCRSGNKARGVTGGPSPVGDPFDIDYVAHEMGHQYGANHTFNSQTGSCGGGNRNASTAYEPGSGSTIMAYAGICGSDDLQSNSDAFFHLVSLEEIATYTISGSGNSCPTITTTGNTPPVPTVGSSGFTIPMQTPFKLTGSATDANNDTLTYCWEEYDLGSAGSPGSPSGNAPIFRSLNPTLSPTRVFPKWSNLLNNSSTIGELLPTYARTLTFRLTARDNKITGGSYGYANISFSVSAAAGPFTVTVPNTNVTWEGNSTQTVTWNVANTNTSPVNCANVKITLSTDGGTTWPYVLAESTANDGSEQVVVPNVNTTTARLMIAAVGNIFFDISNANFKIIPGGSGATAAMQLEQGWNMVSVPIVVSDMSGSILFPQANSAIYAYNDGYFTQTTLSNGRGYWVRYPAASSYNLSGTNAGLTTVPLLQGWNMIGIYNTSAAVANLTTTPAGIVNSSFYGYSNGYSVASTLAPGKGYWVRASQAGTLNLASLAKQPEVNSSKIQKDWTRLTITDANGSAAVLYLAANSSAQADNSFDLPPVPPAGTFDVRFASQRYVEKSGTQTIQISGASYPVDIRIDGGQAILRDNASSGKALSGKLLAGQSLRINNAGVASIDVISSESPDNFTLNQNYPNPFNPSTVISYQIPASTAGIEFIPVSLVIYDVLGNQIATLVNEKQQPGNYNATWNAAGYPSGVYFYKLEAGAFSAVRKLALTK